MLDNPFLLAFHFLPQIRINRLLKIFEKMEKFDLKAEDIFSMDKSDFYEFFNFAGVYKEVIYSSKRDAFKKAVSFLNFAKNRGIKIYTYFDRENLLLKKFEGYFGFRFPFLYVMGDEGLISKRKFSFVCSRNVEEGDRDFLRKFEEVIKFEEGILVSSLYRWAYRVITEKYLDLGKECVIVLDRGIRWVFKSWLADYDSGRYLVLSIFSPEDMGTGYGMYMRDRIVFSLSDIVYVYRVREGGIMEGEVRLYIGKGGEVRWVG